MNRVQIQVQFEDVHARFPEETEVALFGVFLDERGYIAFAHSAFARNTRYLELSGGWRDVRIEARAGRGG